MNRIASAAGTLVDHIRINSIKRSEHHGRGVWIKKRRPVARLILGSANLFFRLAKAPLRAIGDPLRWQRWEIDCFELLHGGEFHAFAPDPYSAGAEELPGINLTIPLDNGTLTPVMAAAAGRELRRAHQCISPEFAGPWSHGDPHLGNFIYEAASDRARLIDFEVMHLPSCGATERHADDLLVFLQDMVGRIKAESWLPCAEAFLTGYNHPELTHRVLPSKFQEPSWGFARLWWMVRIGHLPAVQWRARLDALQGRLQSGSCPGSGMAPEGPSGLIAITHSATGCPPRRCS
ncbi:MAG: hypothetical protein V4710_17530 [Verrucomicrobiota bacterium]